jgi:hypothetical protein
MTVAFDAQLDLGSFTTTTPDDTTFTPAGTPRGIVVVIAQNASSTDIISGVTYGGDTMDRIATAADTAGETGRVYVYFLGTSIPTGAQTVSIAHSGAATVKWAACYSVTAGGDTEIGDFGSVAENAANPTIALDTGATTSIRFGIVHSGRNARIDLTAFAGMEAWADGPTIDYGNQVAIAGRESSPSSGSFDFGYTVVDDDIAMVAVAVQEIAAATPATVTPAATARSFTVNAATAAGKAVSAPAATARSFTVDAVVVKGSAVRSSAATTTAIVIPQVTAGAADTPATVTPDPIAGVFDLLASVQVGGAVVSLGTNSYAIVVPQATPSSPASVAPAATVTTVTLPLVTVEGGSVVETGMSVAVTMPTPTLQGGAVVLVDSADLTVVASQPEIIIGEAETGDKFIDKVWSS